MVSESNKFGAEVKSVLLTLFGEDEDIGAFFRGFLVKVYSEQFKAFIFAPIHTVRHVGVEGQMEVDVLVPQDNGGCGRCTLLASDLWPTHPEHQKKAQIWPSNTLGDGDLYCFEALAEVHGYHYLFPVAPRLTKLRRELLRGLKELHRWRTKDARCNKISAEADGLQRQINEKKKDLDFIYVNGQARLPSEEEKTRTWDEIYGLEQRWRDHVAKAEREGFSQEEMSKCQLRVDKVLRSLEMGAHAARQEDEEEVAELRRRAVAAQKAAWAPAAAPQDPRRQGAGGSAAVGAGGVGPTAAHVTSLSPAWQSMHAEASAGMASAGGDQIDSPRAGKRLRTTLGGEEGAQQGSQGGGTPRPSKLQHEYMCKQAALLSLLNDHGAVEKDGNEDWSKLSVAVFRNASALKRDCKALESQLRAEGQAVPSDRQIAIYYAALRYQHRGGQDQPPAQADGPRGGGQQPGLLLQQQEGAKGHALGGPDGEPWRPDGVPWFEKASTRDVHSVEPLQPRLQKQAGQGYGALNSPCRVPAGGIKWKGRVELGKVGKDDKVLKSGTIWAEPMQLQQPGDLRLGFRGPLSGTAVAAGGAASLEELKNRPIPLIFPKLEPLPALQDLIPEIGVLSFAESVDLASMIEFATSNGWYVDASPGVVPCGMSSLNFNKGYHQGKRLEVYVLTTRSTWARQELASQLRDAERQLFLGGKAFLVLISLGPRKRSEPSEQGRGAGIAPGLPTREAASTELSARSAGDGATKAPSIKAESECAAAAVAGAEAATATSGAVAAGPGPEGALPAVVAAAGPGLADSASTESGPAAATLPLAGAAAEATAAAAALPATAAAAATNPSAPAEAARWGPVQQPHPTPTNGTSQPHADTASGVSGAGAGPAEPSAAAAGPPAELSAAAAAPMMTMASVSESVLEAATQHQAADAAPEALTSAAAAAAADGANAAGWPFSLGTAYGVPYPYPDPAYPAAHWGAHTGYGAYPAASAPYHASYGAAPHHQHGYSGQQVHKGRSSWQGHSGWAQGYRAAPYGHWRHPQAHAAGVAAPAAASTAASSTAAPEAAPGTEANPGASNIAAIAAAADPPWRALDHEAGQTVSSMSEPSEEADAVGPGRSDSELQADGPAGWEEAAALPEQAPGGATLKTPPLLVSHAPEPSAVAQTEETADAGQTAPGGPPPPPPPPPRPPSPPPLLSHPGGSEAAERGYEREPSPLGYVSSDDESWWGGPEAPLHGGELEAVGCTRSAAGQQHQPAGAQGDLGAACRAVLVATYVSSGQQQQRQPLLFRACGTAASSAEVHPPTAPGQLPKEARYTAAERPPDEARSTAAERPPRSPSPRVLEAAERVVEREPSPDISGYTSDEEGM